MSAARSGVGWFIAKVTALGASWLALAYFARALNNPQATLGQFYLFETIVSFLILGSNSGTGGAIIQRISSVTDQQARDRYLGAGIIIIVIRLVIVVLVMIAALPFYNQLFDQGVLIGGIILLLVAVLQIKRITGAVLQGQSRVGRSGIVGLVDSSMQALAQSLFVFFGAGLVGLAGGAVVGTAIAATVGVVLIDQSISVAWPSKEDILSVASFTKYNFLSGVATKFYDNIDILTIKYFLDDSAVGVYGIGFRFALPIQIFSGAISDVTMPEISKEAADNNTERVTELISDSIIFAIIIALPAVVGVAVLAEELVITAFSSSFIDSTNIAIVGVAIQIPASLRSVFNSALNAADYPDVSARAGFLVVVINLILDILLVPLIGPLGAIVASLVAIGTATTYLGYRVFSIFSLSITDLPLHELAVEIAAALFMGCVVYGITIISSLPNFYLLAFTIPTGALVYFTTLFIFSASIRGRILSIANDILPIDLQI